IYYPRDFCINQSLTAVQLRISAVLLRKTGRWDAPYANSPESFDGCTEGAVMLADISNVDAIYIVCGRTDMRKSIDGLCAIIKEQFSMEIDHALYLFCGRKCDRIKAILKEPDGIVMIYKRLTAQGSYRWPRNKSEVRNLTWREFDWLMSGIDIEQPKAIRTS
ncbi:IS66 family insertion sequence element accessory protein TnpB, partial [Bariatricus sp. HCP3S3_E12]|uniref:IS66 family insertion sequence element accessory protein TnpB n=1 Tax=Bariatricus sp. HCP3S3_E12 TaxID=3438906 RepID=UPI003F8AA199